MYNPDYKKIIVANLPTELKMHPELWTEVRINLDYAYALIKPLQTTGDKFAAVSDAIDYRLLFSGQVIYLEHILNDLYDAVTRGIYITNTSAVKKWYLYNKSENAERVYTYNKWDAAVNYTIGQYSTVQNEPVETFIYEALTNNINKNPVTSPADWTKTSYSTKDAPEVIHLYDKAEIQALPNFIVHVPTAVYSGLSASEKDHLNAQITSTVNRYKQAGKTFEIQEV